MKKLLFLTAIAVFALTTTNAQDEDSTGGYMSEGGYAAGDFYVSGSVGLLSLSTDGNSNTAYSISPGIGYFLNDNICLDADLTFSDPGTDNSSTVGAGLGAEYFFTPGKQFSFLVYGGFDYESTEIAPDAKNNTWFLGLAPGVNFFISNAFALRASVGSLGYASSKDDTDGAEATNAFGVNFDLTEIEFGLTYKF